MKEINLVQGSDEWKLFRINHIGCSDISAILGVSRWKTKADIWKQKTGNGEEQVDNEHMARGRRLEPIIRDQINKDFECNFVPAVFEHETLSFLSASLDGWDKESGMALEIKAPGSKDHECARQGVPPIHYFPQLMGICEVCELNEIRYSSFYEGERIDIIVRRDQVFIDDMLEKLEEFWESVQNFIAPDEIHKIMEDSVWNQLAMDWRKCQEEKRNILTREENLRSMLISHSGSKNAKGCGLRLSKNSRKGSPDLFRIVEEFNIDMDKYRKPATEYWRIIDESI
jgi:putative phage-type endonuclease